MSSRILIVLGLLSASCASAPEPDTRERLAPGVQLDSNFTAVDFQDSDAFAYESKDPTGATIYRIFVGNRSKNTRCIRGGMTYDPGQSGFDLRFNAGPRDHVARDGYAPRGYWIVDDPYRTEDATVGTAFTKRTDANHVEVEADFVFPSGTVRGTVVATVCR
jgi:hypothetical protein